jgi:hypothetical protein
MRDPHWAFHQAVYRLLKDGSGYEVYDFFPQQAKFPYIALGEATNGPWDDKSKPGHDFLYSIHLWSQYQGRQEITTMTDVVLGLLFPAGGWQPDLEPNHRLVLLAKDMIDYVKDLDGISVHGIVRLKALIEEV